jgi:hypothetical protein
MANEPGTGAGPPKGLPRRIGGYRVLRELGKDRLGPVLLARHGATGRLVALTVLKPEWACLLVFVDRLARDAFAASQVAHPNLVRLIEWGEARGRVYFASELVNGQALAERVEQQGPLPPREAVVHVLQAARGLKFAHGQGLFHGDVGPEAIIVDDQGVTRVARLGLAKTPQSVAAGEARAQTGPIPPGDRWVEEARAAARVDLRGLGRTLHQLLTGSPPVGGDSATIAPRMIARGVAPDLAALVGSLVEARPESGSVDLGLTVAALERTLNAQDPGSTAPGEEHTRTLMDCIAGFRAAPAAQRRRRVVQGAAAGWAFVVLVSLLARQPRVAAGFLGLGLMSVLAYFVVNGVTRRTELFAKVRALVLESRGNGLVGMAVLALVLTFLVVFHLHWAYLGFGILGVVVALALHFEFDRRVEAERRGAVDEARALLKALRLRGVGEETLRRFVRTAAGDDWEEFFEALFGFDAVGAAREPSDRGLRGLIRKRSVPWREWITAWVEARLEARRQAREQLLLQSIEERGLVAEGVNLLTARRKARRIAEAMVAVSAEIHAAAREPAPPTGTTAAGPPSIARAIDQAVHAPEHVLVEREHGLIRPETFWVWQLLFGPRARFLLGAVLVVGCLLWVDQNGIVTGTQIQEAAARAVEHPDPLKALRDTRIDVHVPAQTKPLHLPFLPQPLANLFQGWGAGAAGVILILSALIRGARMALFALPGAAVAMIGPRLDVPAIGPLDSAMVSMAIGAGVALLGVCFGRSRVG